MSEPISQGYPETLPKVSIGMPVYNGEKYIREALDSLLAQTFTDFELIISDNGSTDGTEAICREYANKDSRIRYLRQPENRGATANFQFVLDKAIGEYFMWAAADDEWLPTFISECFTALQNDPSIGFVVTKYTVESRLGPMGSLWNIRDLKCVTYPDRERRVLSYSIMPFHSYKDCMVYGLWHRDVIAGILVDLRQSPLCKILIGGSMNEYALSLYKGGFVNKALFRKKYRFFPPGHLLAPIANFAIRIIIHLRHPHHRERGKSNYYTAKQHLIDLRVVLQQGRFDESYILRVIDANKYHIKFQKALRG